MNISDKWCFGTFIAMITIYICIGVASFGMGQSALLAAPFDMNGNPCADGTFLYFLTPKDGYQQRTACVKECPVQGGKLDCSDSTIDCKENASPTDPNKQVLVYDTAEYHKQACFPTDYKYFQEILPALKVSGLQMLGKDMKHFMPSVLLTVGLGILIFTLVYRYAYVHSWLLLKYIKIGFAFGCIILVFELTAIVDQSSDAAKINKVGDARPLIPDCFHILILAQNVIPPIQLCLLASFGLAIVSLIIAYFDKLDISHCTCGIMSIYNLLSYNINYMYIPLGVCGGLIINYIVFYVSTIQLIAFGSMQDGMAYQQFTTSPVGIVLVLVQFMLFIIISVTLCLLVDLTLYALLMRSNQVRDPPIASAASRISTHGVVTIPNIFKECLKCLGSVFYLALITIIYSPLQLVNIGETRVSKWVQQKQHTIRFSVLSSVYQSIVDQQTYSLQEARADLDQEESDNISVEKLYKQGTSLMCNGQLSITCGVLILQVMCKCNFWVALLNSLLAYQIASVTMAISAKGPYAMAKLKILDPVLNQYLYIIQDQIKREQIP